MSKLFKHITNEVITFHSEEDGLHVFFNKKPLHFFTNEEILHLKDAKIIESLLSLIKNSN